jgi:hypothetical protein
MPNDPSAGTSPQTAVPQPPQPQSTELAERPQSLRNAAVVIAVTGFIALGHYMARTYLGFTWVNADFAISLYVACIIASLALYPARLTAVAATFTVLALFMMLWMGHFLAFGSQEFVVTQLPLLSLAVLAVVVAFGREPKRAIPVAILSFLVIMLFSVLT